MGRKSPLAFVSADSFIDRDSWVLGDADVLKSNLYSSRVDSCVVKKSRLIYAIIQASLIINSNIKNSKISIEYVADSAIKNASIFGQNTKVITSAIENVSLTNAHIENAVLKNWGAAEVDLHDGYITGGSWERAPRIFHVRIEDENYNDVTLTEAENGHLHVNCTKFPVEKWIRLAHRFGRIYGMSPALVDSSIEFARSL